MNNSDNNQGYNNDYQIFDTRDSYTFLKFTKLIKDINITDINGGLLHHVYNYIEDNKIYVIKNLVSRNIDVFIRDYNGCTILHLMSRKKYLNDLGDVFDVFPRELYEIPDKFGNRPIDLCIYTNVIENHPIIFKLLYLAVFPNERNIKRIDYRLHPIIKQVTIDYVKYIGKYQEKVLIPFPGIFSEAEKSHYEKLFNIYLF